MFRRHTSPEPDVFATEVLSHLEPLYGAAMRLTRSRPDAEDLVQDALVRAFRSRDRFAPGTNVKAWLYTILHNAWRNHRRDGLRDPVAVDSDLVEAAASRGSAALDTPESVLIRETLAPDLQAALDELPDAFRQAVWLRDVEGFSYAEIAGMLGVPIGTVMSRISRGRRQLFETLSEGTASSAGPGPTVGP
jgi:RNA polymerase sigma-70 factor (ECF subfamily)